MNYLVVIAVASLALFCSGADAQCYNCTLVSMTGTEIGPAGCKPPFNKDGIPTVPCEGKCSYSIAEMAANDMTPAMTTWMRTCETSQCIEITDFEMEGMKMTKTCCTGELCNNAGLIQFSLALIIAPLFAILF